MKTEAKIADPKCGLKGRAWEVRWHYINYHITILISVLISIYIAKQRLPEREASQRESYVSGVIHEVGQHPANRITGIVVTVMTETRIPSDVLVSQNPVKKAIEISGESR